MNLDNYVCEGQMNIFDLDIWSGKMCPEPSVQIKERTLDVSLKKSPKLQTKTPLFLDLRETQNGQTQDSYWVTDIQSLGVYTISNTSAAPKDEKGYVYLLTSMETPQEKYSLNCGEKPLTEKPSKLSEILESNPDPKYQLSAKACAGILNRANRRGKKLPEVLEQAMRNQIAHTPSRSEGGADRDSNGKSAGKGALVQTERSGTLGVSQDQTLIQCLNGWDVQSKHIQSEDGVAEPLYSGECRGGGGESYVMQTSDGDIAGTLDASYYKGCGLRQGREITVVCIGNGQMDNMSMKPIANSLDTMHDQQAVMVQKEPILLESNQNHATVQEDGISTALPASMGMGGGYVPMITYGLDRASFNQGKNAQYDFSVEEEIAQTLVAKGPGGGTSETVGALCARDFKGVGSQYVNEQKVIVQEARTPTE